MIDHDISHELHSLAATVEQPIDLVALHRRMAVHNRRRAAAKVGCAGLGVAAIVGGLIVLGEDRPAPAPAASQPSPASWATTCGQRTKAPLKVSPACLTSRPPRSESSISFSPAHPRRWTSSTTSRASRTWPRPSYRNPYVRDSV